VRRVLTMLRPVCFYAVEDGRYARPDLRRGGVRWHSCCYLCCCRGMVIVAVERLKSCWIRAWFTCSYPLCRVMSVPSVRMGAMVGGHAALGLARGRHASLERGGSVPRGSGAPVPVLQGLSEAENTPDGLQGSGALMTSWGSDEAKGVPEAWFSSQNFFGSYSNIERWDTCIEY
jgi:hypothetical protein